MATGRKAWLLRECSIEGEGTKSPRQPNVVRPVRSVTVNLAESPLGWSFSRGLLTQRQFDAGERLRFDWERGQLAPRVTIAWDSTPMAGGAADRLPSPTSAGRRSTPCGGSTLRSPAPGKALADILWRIVCAGEGMREVESALGWPAPPGKVVLTLALDRVADYYRIR